MPEPDHRGLRRRSRHRLAQPDPRAAAAGPFRAADPRLHGRPLWRFRPVSAALQDGHSAAVAGSAVADPRRPVAAVPRPGTPTRAAGPRVAQPSRARPRTHPARKRMSAFLLGVVVLVAGALAWLLPPLLRQRSTAKVTQDAVNAAVYRDQLRELDADLRAGVIAAEQHAVARQELERRVLEDLGTKGATQSPQRSRRAWIAAVALGLAIPVCAFLVYFAVGTPQAVVPGAVEQAAADAA